MYWGCVVRWSELCEAMFNKSLLLTCRYFNIHLQWPFSYYWRTHSFLFLSNTYIHACRHTTFMQCVHSSTLSRLLSHMVFSRICFCSLCYLFCIPQTFRDFPTAWGFISPVYWQYPSLPLQSTYSPFPCIPVDEHLIALHLPWMLGSVLKPLALWKVQCKPNWLHNWYNFTQCFLNKGVLYTCTIGLHDATNLHYKDMVLCSSTVFSFQEMWWGWVCYDCKVLYWAASNYPNCINSLFGWSGLN